MGRLETPVVLITVGCFELAFSVHDVCAWPGKLTAINVIRALIWYTQLPANSVFIPKLALSSRPLSERMRQARP